MALQRTFSNFQAVEDGVYSTDGSASTGILLGFQAVHVRVYNDKAMPVYVTLNSTAGSTAGHRTCASEDVLFQNTRTVGIGLASTTTSTGTIVRVVAWGD